MTTPRVSFVRSLARAAVWTWFAAFVTGCATNPVVVRDTPVAETFRAWRRSAIDGRLSVASTNLLHDLGIGELANADPKAIVAALRPSADEPSRALLLAELLVLAAARCGADLASDCHLEAMLAAGRGLRAHASSAASATQASPVRHALLVELHAFALASFLERSQRTDPPSRWGRVDGIGRSFVVEARADADAGDFAADFFDTMRPAASLSVRGVRSRHVRAGIGAPLMAVRSRRDPLDPLDRYYPPEGRAYPATLVLAEDGPERLVARICDPTRRATVALGDGVVPLAADFTIGYAALLGGARLHEVEDLAFFDADSEDARRGIYFLEPFAPTKTPVLLVHGLLSSPLTWRELTNEILGDERTRDAFQVWHCFYPTGAPILNNVRDLRLALAELHADLTAAGHADVLRDVVVVGHSMGGVITKALVQSSGDTIWNARFTVPLSTLELSEAPRTYAESTYWFTAVPFVKRVVFVAAPHRGSDEADSFVGRIGAWLQARTRRVRDFAAEVERVRPGAMRPGTATTPSSVDVLSPSHVVLRALAELPIASGVRYHTIAGDLGNGSDGVVTVASSRLVGAESELVLPGAAHDVQQDPRAIAEVLRILALHRGTSVRESAR